VTKVKFNFDIRSHKLIFLFESKQNPLIHQRLQNDFFSIGTGFFTLANFDCVQYQPFTQSLPKTLSGLSAQKINIRYKNFSLTKVEDVSAKKRRKRSPNDSDENSNAKTDCFVASLLAITDSL
jgi:hypothetical protein